MVRGFAGWRRSKIVTYSSSISSTLLPIRGEEPFYLLQIYGTLYAISNHPNSVKITRVCFIWVGTVPKVGCKRQKTLPPTCLKHAQITSGFNVPGVRLPLLLGGKNETSDRYTLHPGGSLITVILLIAFGLEQNLQPRITDHHDTETCQGDPHPAIPLIH